MDNDYLPKTLHELESWMRENCYNFNSYSINGNSISEGFGIENYGGLFIWYYIERGEMNKLKYFPSESDIVEYAFGQIKNDEWAKNHCIGFTNIEKEKCELEDILKEIGVEYFQDTIPFYNLAGSAYRTFVVGCALNKTKHLKQKYYKAL